MLNKIHIQRNSFASLCGQRIGTPGATIYSGVFVQRIDQWNRRTNDEQEQMILRGEMCLSCIRVIKWDADRVVRETGGRI